MERFISLLLHRQKASVVMDMLEIVMLMASLLEVGCGKKSHSDFLPDVVFRASDTNPAGSARTDNEQ